MRVSDVIDRTYNVWLYPAGVDRPTFDTLKEAVTDSVKSLALDGRVRNVPRDSILEVESELILTGDVSGSQVTINERGYLETEAVAHDAGLRVYLDPKYARITIFNAIVGCIGQLYTLGLYRRRVDDTQTFATDETKDLPAGGRRIVSIAVDRSDGPRVLKKGWDFAEFTHYDPVRFRLYRGGATGASMQVVYASDFDSPAAEADELGDLGIPSALQPHLAIGAAGSLLQGREIPRVQIEEIKRLIALQAGVNVGATLNVGLALKRLFESYVAAERRRLEDLDPITFEFVR